MDFSKDSITMHMDYVDGIPYMEAKDDLPVCHLEYSTFPFRIFCSVPCKVVLADKRVAIALYVQAVGCMIRNDGSRIEHEGWVEKTGEPEDYSCVERILHHDGLDVLRWHYPPGIKLSTGYKMTDGEFEKDKQE